MVKKINFWLLFLILLFSTGISTALTYTVAYRNLNQTFTVQHTFNPTAPGVPFYIGPNGAEQTVNDLKAEIMGALTANPTNCTSGKIMNGIDDQGNAENCVNVEIQVGAGLMRFPTKAKNCRYEENGGGQFATDVFPCPGNVSGTATTFNATDNNSVATNMTTSTLNNQFGFSATNLIWRTGQLITIEWQGALEQSSPASMRVWLGVGNTNTITLSNSDLPSGTMAMFRFSTTAGDTNWKCSSSNAGTPAIADTGVPADSTFHYFKIVLDAAKTTASYYIDSSLVCVNFVNVPAQGLSNINMYVYLLGKNLAGGTSTGMRLADLYISAGESS